MYWMMENDLYTRVNKEMVHIEHVTTKIDVRRTERA